MEEDTTLIGTQISNYHLTAEIGSGYLGTVYRARHVVTDSVVALKAEIPRYTEEAILKAIATKRSFRHKDITTFLADVQTPLSRYRLKRQWLSDGQDLNRKGRYEEALEAFEQALAINPQLSLPIITGGLPCLLSTETRKR